MIQYINIMTKDGKSLIFRNYGDSEIDKDLLAGFLSAFSGFMKEISRSDIKSSSTEDFKYYYTVINSFMIVVCADLEDEDVQINSKINKIRAKFIERYGKIIEEDSMWDGNRTIFYKFERELDNIILGEIKVSLIGFGGVGKTTLLHLIAGKDINLDYVPTITANITNPSIQFCTFRNIISETANIIHITSPTKVLLCLKILSESHPAVNAPKAPAKGKTKALKVAKVILAC